MYRIFSKTESLYNSVSPPPISTTTYLPPPQPHLHLCHPTICIYNEDIIINIINKNQLYIMKVTDKKFLNVHQTISPLSVATTVTASSTKGGESSPSSKAEKILVSFGLITRKNKRKRKKYLQLLLLRKVWVSTYFLLLHQKSADTCKFSWWVYYVRKNRFCIT